MRRIDLSLVVLLTLLLVAALSAISWRTLGYGETLLLPELNRKAEVVGRTIAGLVQVAAKHEIPLNELVGADRVLQKALDESPQFESIRLVSASGSLLGEARLAGEGTDIATQVRTPVMAGDTTVAEVVIAIPQSAIEGTVRRIWLDLAVVLIASVLVTFELLAMVFGLGIGRGLRGLGLRLSAIGKGDLRSHPPVDGGGAFGAAAAQIDSRLEAANRRQRRLTEQVQVADHMSFADRLRRLGQTYNLGKTRSEPPPALSSVRAPIFLFFFAEELTRPFLPAFIGGLASPIEGLSREMVISLPIVLFMAIVALSQPFLNGLTERIGRGRALRLGSALAMVGFAGASFSTDLLQLLIARGITATGYAMVFVAAQGYIIDRTERANRARGLAILVGGIFVAALCGPPIGGILADRLGDRSTFLVAALIALVALLSARLTMPSDSRAVRPTAAARPSFRAFMAVILQPQLIALLLLCAFPAKLILGALLFYLIPLTMADGGVDQASIGRILMLYALAMVFLVPYVSKWSDSAQRRPAFIIVGAILGGGAVVYPLFVPDPWGSAMMVAQLGIAQALSITPQSALVGELGQRAANNLSVAGVTEGSVYGVFRLIERAGNAVGPALAAWLLGAYGTEVAMVAVGAIVAGGGALYFLVAMADQPSRAQVAESS